ncbi:PAS domain-containing sensor histidine kinase [Sphingomonas crocodyli]|nr:ATP-binding protein [Sphingomonas crocodyli]
MNMAFDLPPDLFDLSPESIIIYDVDGVVRNWNAASQRLYGWPATTAVGHRLDPLAKGDWLPLDEILATGHWRGEIVRRTIHGSDITTQITVTVRHDEKGQAAELIEFGRKTLTPVKPADARNLSVAIEQQQAGRFEQLLDHLPIALWEIDARAAGQNFARLHDDGVRDLASYLDAHPDVVDFTCDTVLISKVNRAAIQMFGVSSAEPLLGPIRYLYTETPSTANRIMCAHWNGQRHHVEEMKVRTCEGRVLDVLFLVTFLQLDEDVATTFLMLVDISDRVRTEAELAALQANFAHIDRIATLGELVSSIRHELERPLRAAEQTARAIGRDIDRGVTQPALLVPQIEHLMAQALGANETISRVRAMTVKRTPEIRPVDLNAVSRAAMLIVDQNCRENAITLAGRLAPDLADVEGDAVQLQQVMVNLLLNAIHAIADHDVTPRDIVIETSQQDGTIIVEVRDSGIGILDDDIERIFASFVSSRPGAMGLGLSICRSILHAHRGSIDVENRPEGGACVRFRLPAL